jgi:hypothetical protein
MRDDVSFIFRVWQRKPSGDEPEGNWVSLFVSLNGVVGWIGSDMDISR